MNERTFSFTMPPADDEATAITVITMIMDELALDLDQRRRVSEYFYDRYPHIEISGVSDKAYHKALGDLVGGSDAPSKEFVTFTDKDSDEQHF